MSEVSRRTSGYWKPSPGSVYPLLAWLREKGHSREVPEQEPGIKRYTLTDQGKLFLEEHVKRRKELRRRIRFFALPFLGSPCFKHDPIKSRKLVEAGKTLLISIWDLLDGVNDNYSEEVTTDAISVIEQASENLTEMTQKLKKACTLSLADR